MASCGKFCKLVFSSPCFKPVFSGPYSRGCAGRLMKWLRCAELFCAEKYHSFAVLWSITAPISWATMQHVASGSGSFSRISSAPQPHGDLEPDFIPHGVNPSGKRQQRVVSVSSRPFFCRSAVRQYAGNNHQSAKRQYHVPCKIRSAPRYGGNRFIAAKSKRHGARRWPGALAKA